MFIPCFNYLVSSLLQCWITHVMLTSCSLDSEGMAVVHRSQEKFYNTERYGKLYLIILRICTNRTILLISCSWYDDFLYIISRKVCPRQNMIWRSFFVDFFFRKPLWIVESRTSLEGQPLCKSALTLLLVIATRLPCRLIGLLEKPIAPARISRLDLLEGKILSNIIEEVIRRTCSHTTNSRRH